MEYIRLGLITEPVTVRDTAVKDVSSLVVVRLLDLVDVLNVVRALVVLAVASVVNRERSELSGGEEEGRMPLFVDVSSQLVKHSLVIPVAVAVDDPVML